jgi:HlyD family secretion protein
VEEIADALIVPNWAIRLDRETGEAFVNRLAAGDVVEEVVIETGLRNEQFSEVLSGLNEGDTVVVTNEREGFSLFGGE